MVASFVAFAPFAKWQSRFKSDSHGKRFQIWKNHTKEVFYTYMVTIGAASDLSAHDITHNM